MIENLLPNPQVLSNFREFFASGYFEEPDVSPMRRWSRAVRRRFEHRTLMPYNGELLYPCGPTHIGEENRIITPSYSSTWSYNEHALMAMFDNATGEEQETLTAMQAPMRKLVGGGGYTHSVPNYGRVLREGLAEHARRIAE